jgi:hypothetical protein
VSTFRGIQLSCRSCPEDVLTVEKSEALEDGLFFNAECGAALNRRQVRELAARLKAWLDQSDDDANDEWEDL